MTFTEELRKEADPIFQAIFTHPFVQGIGNGDLQGDQLIHYVKQDFEYLNTFIQIYGQAINRCDHREDMAMFNEQISFILDSEIHPHHNFCQVAGVQYEDLQYEPLAPTAHHYTRHMLDVAQGGSLGEILAVLLPCPWTYSEIGDYLKEEKQPSESHPFYDWINFYSREGDMSVTEKFRARLDAYAESANAQEKERMKDAFIKSCQLEYSFWEMSYQLEKWPVISS
ncbi:thiaminase/transcriptional activator TenA [Geomicrobium halophilum]|uniref:Aminopyrimidine aminohydrolase n=1 Tax=Geomicrobium halophilum TaxID=549000 RepID=A0A841PU97_9BACL|nr:thiaminase II [Geomicrobium halophilum]MBB6449871.1 thiaminase/transcriptional activator TenA [Geomicrobium halophilum]